ncbi:hypothetical protein BN1723_014115 [Verticillium longisporum]|uniref:Nitrate/nitrite transporter n=1 Tax=Verticillium longisporum TaxID=100787 RepID=A0A0G4M1Z2_VERLO|nr:hypothetical protein BN1723_014115 [Verticillium longisporum]
MKISTLWRAPEVNPITLKARSVPVLNPFNKYGRVFLFSWLGFMIAFWAWYTFPPLLTVTIRKDLALTPQQVANSNIVSLSSTLLMRVIAGPACDKFGSRWVFGGMLLLGSLPIGLAPLVNSANGLYVSRFFIGILGGTFVPCQVWCTGFFDKNIVGTANALAGGWGNAGGGVTYFVMPAVFDAFVSRGYKPGVAWRLTFIVPLICIITCGIALLLLCDDTPTGKWSDRHLHVQENLQGHGIQENVPTDVVDVPGGIADRHSTPSPTAFDSEKNSTNDNKNTSKFENEATISRDEMLVTAQGETILKPTFKDGLKVAISPQTIFHMATYACSFGGIVGDVLYHFGKQNLWLKKGWVSFCGIMTGLLLILIGRLNPHDEATMFGLIFLMAVFHEAGNGANFALVPHVHPHANGIVSGLTGAGGNLGGIIFAIIFRFMDNGTNYAKGFWVIGCMHIGLNVLVSWIPPLPNGQIGGR